MGISLQQLVAGLGAGLSLAEVAARAGAAPAEAAAVWQSLCAGKVPPASAELTGAVAAPVEVIRDRYGVPHIYAETEPDLFFGLGLAMAQDRLWQMDYMRRKATGRLAEILGAAYLEQDLMYRTLGFDLVSRRNYDHLGARWQAVVDAMAAGVNQAIAQAEERLPVEFDLLGYRPEPWSPVDVLVGLRYQWWGLSGRLPQITGATILARELGGAVDAFTQPERADVYIVPAHLDRAARDAAPAPVRDTLNCTDHPHGSNNWVVAGALTRTGKPLLANDPHYSYEHGHGLFYECHLHGGGHREAGFVFVGTPGMMTGLNDRIAWGFTNNGTTIRDLYAERLHPEDPGLYRRGDRWESVGTRTVEVRVKGGAPVRRVIRSTAHGPIVSDMLPGITDSDPPLALRWVGFEVIADVQALLEMNTAGNWAEFRAALRNWACSVTNFVYADAGGHIGYQMSARVPLRGTATTGIRPAWHPDHEWQGYIPFDGLPRLEDPPDGIIVTANNRPVSPYYRWPIYGAYAGGTRYTRIRELLEASRAHGAEEFCRIQQDTKALMVEDVLSRVAAALRRSGDPALAEVGAQLAGWDCHCRTGDVQPAIIEMFMDHWTRAYAAAALPAQPDVQAAAQPAARRALVGEEAVLSPERLDELIAASMRSALQALKQQFGPDQAAWAWGRVHAIAWPHPLGHIGRLGELLNGAPHPVAGTQHTINNVAPSRKQPFAAQSGPTYRFVADLANPAWALVNSVSPTSGHPGSPHYQNSTREWAAGAYHPLHRVRAAILQEAEGITVIRPQR